MDPHRETTENLSWYFEQLESEKSRYFDCENVHELPAIFHFWSNACLRPRLEAFGYSGPNDYFLKTIASVCRTKPHGSISCLSIGAGNCDLELWLSMELERIGFDHVSFTCLDINPSMLERGRKGVAGTSFESRFQFVLGDFNSWAPSRSYEVIIANQSLHHVVKLEWLLDNVRSALAEGGKFIVSDMIGRNGHLRWPAALDLVHHLWFYLPGTHRFNRSFRCYEKSFINRDCSSVGFEGVRSQDILPLLVEKFGFESFFPFGNIIDPFVDRSFGPNFSCNDQEDLDFILAVDQIDQCAIERAIIGPTHLLAVLSVEDGLPSRYPSGLSPEHCLRGIANSRSPISKEVEIQLLGGIPIKNRASLVVCRVLEAMQSRMDELEVSWISKSREVAERVDWAQSLEKDLALAIQHFEGLQEELSSRTRWALELNSEVEQLILQVGELQSELEARTKWALQLDEQIAERNACIKGLQSDLCKSNAEVNRLRSETEGVRWFINLRRIMFDFFQQVRRSKRAWQHAEAG
jgi:SAM-dependent methyltransferase